MNLDTQTNAFEASDAVSYVESNETSETVNEVVEVSVSLIDTDFQNTRKSSDPKVVLALSESIKSNGLINPITLHQKADGRYSVVAGFTRYEAVKTLQHETVLARVYTNLSNAELLEISLSENTVRQDLSISQQLYAMKRVMTEIGSVDASTLASRLMWTKSHVNSLLKVSRSPECVLDALDNGEIELGHATYLVQLLDIGGGDIEQNTKLIEKTICKIKAEKWSVKMLKNKVVAKHIPLALAKFDTTQTCDGCEFNSSTYGSLFDFNNESAMCTKPSCYQRHSATVLENVKALAEERFGNVIALSTLANAQVAPVSVEVLGETQLTNCNTCTDNIAIINDSITAKAFTQVKDGLCRNNKCYAKCAKAFADSSRGNSDSTETNEVNQVETGQAVQTVQPSQAPKADIPVNLGDCTEKQKLLSQKALSEQMLTRLNDADVLNILVGYAVQSIAGKDRNVADAIQSNPLLVTGTAQQAIQASFTILKDYLATCTTVEGTERNSPRSVLLSLLANVSDKDALLKASWDTNTQLETYTIKGIIAICEESGFSEHYGREAFIKKAKGSKKDLLKAISDKAWDGWAEYYPASHAKSVGYSTIEVETTETETQTTNEVA